jgi:hypothetical protein
MLPFYFRDYQDLGLYNPLIHKKIFKTNRLFAIFEAATVINLDIICHEFGNYLGSCSLYVVARFFSRQWHMDGAL